MRAGFLCFRRPKEPETIWLHSFSAGRIYDNAYLLASLPVLRRDKPKALVLAAVAARWMQPARRPPFLCESHLHFDGNPFAGIGQMTCPFNCGSMSRSISHVPEQNAPKRVDEYRVTEWPDAARLLGPLGDQSAKSMSQNVQMKLATAVPVAFKASDLP